MLDSQGNEVTLAKSDDDEVSEQIKPELLPDSEGLTEKDSLEEDENETSDAVMGLDDLDVE